MAVLKLQKSWQKWPPQENGEAREPLTRLTSLPVESLGFRLEDEVQLSLSIQGDWFQDTPADTKIQRCSSPFYKLVYGVFA